jgi:hypothetical protein
LRFRIGPSRLCAAPLGATTGVVGAERDEAVESGLKSSGECDFTGVVAADCESEKLEGGVLRDWPPGLELFFGMLIVRPILFGATAFGIPLARSGNGLLVATRLRNWSDIVTSTRYLILASFSLYEYVL